jgi:hypothetical protein
MSTTQSETVEKAASTNILTRLWDGDLSLAVTFWIWIFSANIICNALFFYILITFESKILAQLIFLPAAIYFVVAYVGLWRSANKYKGRKIWASLARLQSLMAGVGLLSIVLSAIM